jgi:peptidoglycan hydrolase-like protein with peptidoglycan-binding domain
MLRTGDSGPDVAELQARLDRLIAPTWIAVTGVFDTRTADAVAYAQQLLNVSGDPAGVFGPHTYAALLPLTQPPA